MGKRKKKVAVISLEVPKDFLPIALIEPEFKQASYVVSFSEPFLFFDSEIGEIEGFVQRYDKTLSGEIVMPDAFLSISNIYLTNVTHFKTI